MAGLIYPEAEILRVSKVTRDNAFANAAGLSKFGWDMAEISLFSQDIAAAEALGNEDSNLLEQKSKTVDKDQALRECGEWMKDLRVRAKKVFKRTSPELAAFPFRQLREAFNSEGKMMPVMETGIKFGSNNELALLPAGHTPEVQAAGVALYDALSEKDTAQEDKKETNQEATQVRYLKYDNLYKKVNAINAAGRRAFRNQPEKLVLFNSPWPKKKKASEESPSEPPVVPPAQ